MSNMEAIILTIVSFILAAVVCLVLFGGDTDNPLMLPVYLISLFLIGFVLAELSNRTKKK